MRSSGRLRPHHRRLRSVHRRQHRHRRWRCRVVGQATICRAPRAKARGCHLFRSRTRHSCWSVRRAAVYLAGCEWAMVRRRQPSRYRPQYRCQWLAPCGASTRRGGSGWCPLFYSAGRKRRQRNNHKHLRDMGLPGERAVMNVRRGWRSAVATRSPDSPGLGLNARSAEATRSKSAFELIELLCTWGKAHRRLRNRLIRCHRRVTSSG